MVDDDVVGVVGVGSGSQQNAVITRVDQRKKRVLFTVMFVAFFKSSLFQNVRMAHLGKVGGFPLKYHHLAN